MRKICSNKGESIAEVLVAALIISLGAILLVTMINASYRIIQQEEKSYKDFITSKNQFEAESFGGATSSQVTIKYGESNTYNRVVTVYSKVINEKTFYRYEAKDE